jgi:hypothetical protein
LIGLTPADQPTSYQGHLLVLPTNVFVLPLPPAGLSLQGSLPCDSALCGVSVFMQGLEFDAAASRGIAFTPGLELFLGR